MDMWELGTVEVNDNENEMVKNKASFNVYHCEECNQSYEMSGNTIFYHTDFPAFGLERETCCNCNN